MLYSTASIVWNGTEDVDNCSILITVTEIIRCAIQHTSLDVAPLIASQALCGWVSPPWREKDVIFSVMHIPAQRWACKELGWLRAQGTEARCAQLWLPVNTKDVSQETLLSASVSFSDESWITQSVSDIFYNPPVSSCPIWVWFDFLPLQTSYFSASKSKNAIKHLVVFIAW